MGSVSRLHTPGCFGNSPLAPAHNAPVAPVQPAAEAPLDTLGGEPEHLMVTLFPTFFLFNLALFPEFLFLKMSVLS